MKSFYCQKICVAVDFSIDEWNKAFNYCIKNKLTEKQMSEILEPKACAKQCFDCMAIVGETRLKNKAIREKIFKK